jgi:hypothetical protein
MAVSTAARQIHRAHVEPHLAGHDAGDVEQVVDELHLGHRVALDDLEAPGERRCIHRAVA